MTQERALAILSAAFVTFSCFLGVFAVLAVPVAAQAPDAPPPSPDNATLYVHHKDMTDEQTGWMNTLKADKDATDPSMGSGSLPRTYTISLAPPLPYALILEKGGKIALNAYIGAQSGAGAISVTTAVTHGGETVATGESKSMNYLPSTEAYGKLTWSLEPKLERLEAGMGLNWTITISGTVVNGVFLGASESRGQSNMVLPIAAIDAAPKVSVQYADLVGEEASILLEFQNETDAIYQYNWTTNLTSGQLDYFVDVMNGTATFDIMDGDNMSVLSGEFNMSDSQTLEISSAAPGDWVIMLNFTAFSGMVDMTVSAGLAATTTTGNATGTGNETGEAEGEGGFIPAPTAVAAAAAMIAVVAWRHRALRKKP